MTSVQKNLIFLNYFKIIFAPIIYEITFLTECFKFLDLNFLRILNFKKVMKDFD